MPENIIKHKQKERETFNSHQKYQSLINAIDGIVWEADPETLRFSFVSNYASTLLGYEIEQWLDEPAFWQNHIYVDDRQRVIECYFNCALQKEACEIEYRMIASNKKIIWLQDKISVIIENGKTEYLCGIMTDISDSKNQQLLLKESNTGLQASEQHLKNVSSELEKVMNYSLDVICSIDKAGKFLRVSAACCDMWGYEPGELIGNFYMDHVDPDYEEITNKSLSDIMSGIATTNFENRFVHKNGSSVPLIWSARWDEKDEIMFCVARDASALKEAQRMEAESEQRWKTIFNRANDAILLTSNSGRYIQVNSAAAKILGYTTDELLQLSVKDILVHPETYNAQNDPDKILMDKGQQSGVIELKRKDGSIVICYYNAVANIFPGLHLSILTDITERENAHRKIDQLNNTLEKHAEDLAASNKELEQFAYVTSHDLQEPLRMVTSFLQLLQKKYENELDETAQRYITYAVDGAERMKTLILDLLEYSRISSVKENHSVIDLNDVLKKTLQMLSASIDESQAIILYPVFPELYGNRSQLMQLFQNLISNALKYRSATEMPNVQLGFTENESFYEFFIKDNGIGIDPKFFEKIFVIFQRLHNRNEFEGTGIGLSICKRIVELHGGKIWVESLYGSGSTFYFTIAKHHDISKIPVSIPDGSEIKKS